MAPNVFGNPITDATLQAMPKYANKNIKRSDRAREAFDVKNLNDKYTLALQYAENLKAKYGNGVCTLCVFYNATGGTLRFVRSYDWDGHVWKSPYPTQVANGQWGAFLHVHTAGTQRGSTGGVVYRGNTVAEQERDWVFSWCNPWKRTQNRKVYGEAHLVDHYADDNVWGIIKNAMNGCDDMHAIDCAGQCVIETSIGDKTPVVFEALFTVSGADLPPENYL